MLLLIRTILAACKEISFESVQGALSGVLGSTLDENIQGETQKKLDVLSKDQLLKDILLESGYVKAIASEEEEGTVAGNPEADYIVAFDPLDGSSNTDINSLVGTIFSVMRVPKEADASDPAIFLQGEQQVAAGYVLYGPSTMLALTTVRALAFSPVDRTHGSFLLTQDFASVPVQTQEFAINASNQRHWQAPMQQYIADLLAGKSGPRGKNFNMRWIAAMVGDVHRVLCRGGLFTYPADTKNPDKPYKLRLLYEANPMAMLIEQAGGLASTGEQRIMEIEPQQIRQRVAVILGSKDEAENLLKLSPIT